MKKKLPLLITTIILCLTLKLDTGYTREVVDPIRRLENSRLIGSGKNNSAESNTSGGWIYECIECPKQFEVMGERSLQIDSKGQVHIVYGGDHLYYAWQEGIEWQYETVDSSTLAGDLATLDLDSAGNPHIIYIKIVNYHDIKDLKYAYKDDLGWHIQTIASNIIWDGISLAIDRDGYPHVSYTSYHPDNDYNLLNYAYLDKNGWHYETIFSEGWSSDPSLSIDSNGLPQLLFIRDNDLFYASKEPGGWIFEIIDRDLFFCYINPLALDNDGFPHISYSSGDIDSSCEYNNLNLKYAYKDKMGWHTELVNENGFIEGASYPSLALDNDGFPHISYRGQYSFKYASKDETGWHIQVSLDTGSYTYISPIPGPICLDEYSYPHIIFLDHIWTTNYMEKRNLKYLYLDANGWHTSTIDSTGSAGLDSSMALDVDGHPHLSYTGEGYLKYAVKDGIGWSKQTLDTNGEGMHLILDGNGDPHISYFNLGELKYTHREDGEWYIESIDYGDGQTILELDEHGYPRINYSITHEYGCWKGGCAYETELRYAFEDETGWYTQTLGIGSPVECPLSEYYGEDGYLHKSYYEYWEYGILMYSYHDILGEHIHTVDDQRSVLGCPSLVLDEHNYPNISYYDASNEDLRYAFRQSPFYGVALSPLKEWRSGMPGETITYTMSVTNTGQVTDTFKVVINDNLWTTLAPSKVGPLEHAQNTIVDINVQIPPNEAIGIWDRAIITLTSLGDNQEFKTARFLSHSGYIYFDYLPILEK